MKLTLLCIHYIVDLILFATEVNYFVELNKCWP